MTWINIVIRANIPKLLILQHNSLNYAKFIKTTPKMQNYHFASRDDILDLMTLQGHKQGFFLEMYIVNFPLLKFISLKKIPLFLAVASSIIQKSYIAKTNCILPILDYFYYLMYSLSLKHQFLS